MNSTQSRPVGDGAPAPPIFSYAQAAKGRATATAASAVQFHQSNLSGVNTPAKDTNSTSNTPSGGSERGDRSVNGSFEAINRPDSTAENRNQDVKGASSIQPDSSPTSPSLGTASASTTLRDEKEDKEDDFVLVGHPGSGSSKDKTSHDAGGPTEKQVEVAEGRKGKKGKKQKISEKEAEKEKEEAKPEILVPAPLPAVNFWAQRKEEFAKAKPVAAPVQTPATQQETTNAIDPTSPQPSKTNDLRKRGKAPNAEEVEKSFNVTQNGGLRESQTIGKGQKKGNESQTKLKEEQSNKRTGSKGNRWNDKEDKSSSGQVPPPVEDAVSWPTPDTALEEEKRKIQEKLDREEKDESAQTRPRPKDKWVTVPYIPTVTFNTPLPPRGGRGRGGARSSRTEPGGRPNHAQNGGVSGEKAQAISGNVSGQISGAEKQEIRDGARATSLPPAKRQSVDQSNARKASVAQVAEKGKSGASHGELTATNDPRVSSSFVQQDPAHDGVQEQQQHRGEGFRAPRIGQSQSGFGDNQNSKSNTDRRNDPNLRGNDHFKDNLTPNKDSNHPLRERVESRSDRGRGGFRGRGNHPNFQNGQPQPQANFANGHSSPNGYPMRQSTAPYSPPLQQGSFNNQYPSSRGGRGGSRSQSIPNNTMYGRYPPNGAPISQHIAPLQTSNPMFDYPGLQPMATMPYQSYIDQASVLTMVTMQMEYYFSIDNLCKDVFLRKHMDGQGFVFLSFIAAFKRIQALTHDFELLRFACQESEIIELVRGEDGIDRLRRKEGWEKWTLNIEERDESTRNNGPTNYQRSHPFRNGPQPGQIIMPAHHSMSPLTFSPTGAEQSFHSYSNGAHPATNGNSTNHQPETPLSAAVPDFSPGVLPINGSHDPLEVETTFHDDEVANLTLVFNQPRGNDDSKGPRLPFHKASSRTFSNGSFDGRSIAEEMLEDTRQGRTLTNGSHASESSPEDFRRSRSPFTPLSPTKSFNNSSPPVMWVKGQRPSLGSESISHELYSDFRARALKYREISPPGEIHPDMKLLYEFWSHFLCRNFNSTMYTEFRQYATEDARNKSLSGMKNLISYYDEILNSKKKVIPEVLARHYVDIVKNESSDERPAFERLRLAWRNGALDMKSRKKIDNLVDPKLREELERAPYQKSDRS